MQYVIISLLAVGRFLYTTSLGGNAKTYMNVGLGLGEKMVELLKNDK